MGWRRNSPKRRHFEVLNGRRAGWQFHRRFVLRTSGRRVFAAFIPQRPGRFRARADYSGSRLAAPSSTGYAYLSAREPF